MPTPIHTGVILKSMYVYITAWAHTRKPTVSNVTIAGNKLIMNVKYQWGNFETPHDSQKL